MPHVLVFLSIIAGCGDSSGTPSASAQAGDLRGWTRFSLATRAEPLAVPTSAATVAFVGPGVTSFRESISADGRHAAFVDETVAIRDVAEHTNRRLVVPEDYAVTGVEFLDGERLAAWGSSRGGGSWIAILALASLETVAAYRHPEQSCQGFTASATHAHCLVESDYDYARRAAVPGSGHVLALDREGRASVTVADTLYAGLAIAAHGSTLVFTRKRGEARELVVLEAGGRTRTAPAPTHPGDSDSVTSLDLSPDGTMLAVGTFASTLTSYRMSSLERVRALPGTGTELHGVRIEDDGTLWRRNADSIEISPPSGESRWIESPCGDIGALAITATRAVHASDGVCAFDRNNGTLDASVTATTPLPAKMVLGERELVLIVTAHDHASRPNPFLLRYDLRSGRLVGHERGAGAVLRAAGFGGVPEQALAGRLPVFLTPRHVGFYTGDGGLDPNRRLRILDATGRAVADADRSGRVSIGASGVMVAWDRSELRVHSSPSAPGRVLDVEGLSDSAWFHVLPSGTHALLITDYILKVVSLRDGSVAGTLDRRRAFALEMTPDGAAMILATSCEEGAACLTRLERIALPRLTPQAHLELAATPRALSAAGDRLVVLTDAGVQIVSMTNGWTPSAAR
jgi:hypothetical protein